MIGQLKGILVEKTPTTILVDVGGVGYEAEISMHTYTQLPAVGEKITVRTHLQVREDAHTLYAFASFIERAAYRQLIRVNGVGPRTALAVLSTFTVPQLTQAVQSGDAKLLTRVPGIGGKTAERMLIDLKDRFKNAITDSTDGQDLIIHGSALAEVRQALVTLGYKEAEAIKLLKDMPSDITVEEGIRAALKGLSKAN